jgi:hypothetical protein
MNGFIITLSLLLLLSLIIIFAIIYYIFFNKIEIEKFTDVTFLYPIITDKTKISIVPIANKTTFNDLFVATAEQYEEPNINDSIIAVYSSFTNNSANPDNKILGFINNNPNIASVNLPILKLTPSSDNSLKDYIFIDLPDDSIDNVLTKVSITYDISTSRYTNDSNIFKIGSVNFKDKNPFDSAKSIQMDVVKSQINSNIITYDYTPKSSPSLFCNLALVNISKVTVPIYIVSINLYFTKVEAGFIPSDIDGETINIISSNPIEQIPVSLPSMTTVSSDSTSTNYCTTIEQKYNKLLKLKIPYVIYDVSNVNGNILPDQLNRLVRNATISGSYEKITEDNITYIKGTTDTSITFPLGSSPKRNFTICAITKYINPTTNRNQVLKIVTINPSQPNRTDINLTIGHNNNASGVVSIDNYNYNSSSYLSDTEWVITCFKINGKNVNKSIIINDKFVGSKFIINDYEPTCSKKTASMQYPQEMTVNYDDYVSTDECDYYQRLSINDQNNRSSCSDFGLAYLMVWHTELLDNEMLIVSKILNNYIKNNIPMVSVPMLPVTTYDGSTEERAAVSAIAIKNVFNTQTNKFYWIKPEGASRAVKIFCIMDEKCEGGGWMLAMKAAPGSTNFKYNSDYWTINNELIPAIDKDLEANGVYMDTTLDAKYNIYNIFPVTDCLAIFDSREFNNISISQCPTNENDLYTDPNYKQYGWRWINQNFNNGIPITLLNYFKNNNRDFVYTCRNIQDKTELTNFMKDIPGAIYKDYSFFVDYIIGNSRTRSGSNPVPPYNNLVWSTQSEFLSYGFNIYIKNWNHRVRWGGTFNENGGSLPDTNDVSGGIGMEHRDYSAGDAIGCCQNTTGVNKSLSFKWFIR